MANIKFGDEETFLRLQRCFSLPVDKGKMTLAGWLSNIICAWGWDSECRLYYDPVEENWFGWGVFDRDGNRVMIGGLIYRDNGWESHT